MLRLDVSQSKDLLARFCRAFFPVDRQHQTILTDIIPLYATGEKEIDGKKYLISAICKETKDFELTNYLVAADEMLEWSVSPDRILLV